MYRWLVFTHVLAVFGFLIAHGASAAVVFKLRSERNVERVRAWLDLSRAANSVANAALLVLLAAGVAAAFMGNWWRYGWVWAALGVLVLISVGMFAFASGPLIRIRQLVQPDEMRHGHKGNMMPSPELPIDQQLEPMLAATHPAVVTLIGGGGLAVILWLMLFKPF